MHKILIADPTGGLEEARQALEMGPFSVSTADDLELIAIMAGDVDIVLVDDGIAPDLLKRLGDDPSRPKVLVVGDQVTGADGAVPAPPDPGRLMEVAMELMANVPEIGGPNDSSASPQPEGAGDDDVFDPSSMLEDSGDADLNDLLGNLEEAPTDSVPADEADEASEEPAPTAEQAPAREPDPWNEPDPWDQVASAEDGQGEASIGDDAQITGTARGLPADEPADVVPDDNPTTVQPVPQQADADEEAPEDTAPDIWALDGLEDDDESEDMPTEKREVPVLDEQGQPEPPIRDSAQPDDSPTRIMTIPELPSSGSEEESVQLRLAQSEFSSAPAVDTSPDEDDELVALFREFELPAIQVEVHEPERSAPASPAPAPSAPDWDGPTVVSPTDPNSLEEAADRIERAVLRYAGYAPLQTIPEVFGRLVTEGETGTLLLRQGDVVKSVAIVEGSPVFATSSQRTDRLGEILYRAAMLTRDQLDAALKEVNSTGQSLGKVLLGQGILNPHDLFGALRRQVLEIIYSIFGWRRGEFSFLTGEPASEDRFPLPLTGRGVVTEGIRRAWTLPEILERFGGQDAVPVPSAQRQYTPEDLDLSEEEARVQGAVDGKRSVGELLAGFAGSEEMASRVLYALLCVGSVRVEENASGAGANGSAHFDEEPVSRETSKVTAAELVEDSPKTGGIPETDELKRRIRAKHEQVKQESYFAILGVKEGSLDVDIKAAYEKMERAFRPERYGAPDFEDVRDLVREIYDAICEAWQVLEDPEMRENYRRGLQK